MIEIEKGIEIPKAKFGQPPKYPVYFLEVGDSFKFPIEAHSQVRMAIRRSKPKKFTIRKIDEGHMRCWRLT